MPIDLRLPKKSKKELAEDMGVGPSSPDQPKYPYGSRVELNEDIIAKSTDLMSADVGDTVKIIATAKVIEKKDLDRQTEQGTKKDRSIEYQLTYIDVQPDSDKAVSQGFDDATKS